MRDPLLNRGLAVPIEEREVLGLTGFLPAGVRTMAQQEEAAMALLRGKQSPLEKYCYLQGLQNVDEHMFFRLLVRHTHECMPLVYTPTVGLACQKWSQLYHAAPRGLYLSLREKGQIFDVLCRLFLVDKLKF